jgi:hypothetical protein
LNHIIDYELPETISKLTKQYEKQKSDFFQINTLINTVEKNNINSLEENLLNKMQHLFDCCGYNSIKLFDFWYRYPDIKISHNCNYYTVCIKEFAWFYIYFSAFIIIFGACLKFCIQFVLIFNFKILLIKKMIKNLYVHNPKKYNENYNFYIEDENEKNNIESFKKLKEIRNIKEKMLKQEEEEEEERREKKEEEERKFIEQEQKQDEYEEMLAKQNRFEELKIEQLNRKLQNMHRLYIM